MRSGVCDGFRGAPRFPRNRFAGSGVLRDLNRGLLEDDSSRGLTKKSFTLKLANGLEPLTCCLQGSCSTS